MAHQPHTEAIYAATCDLALGVRVATAPGQPSWRYAIGVSSAAEIANVLRLSPISRNRVYSVKPAQGAHR